MTWKSFQDSGFRLTEQEIEKLTPYILKQYELAIKDINSQLQKIYANFLTGIKPADYYNEMIKYDRLNKLLTQITREYNQYSIKAGRTVMQAVELGMTNQFYRSLYSFTWLSNVSFGTIPSDLIQIAVYGSLEAYKTYQGSVLEKIFGSAGQYMPRSGTLSSFLTNNRKKEIEGIQRVITQGLLNGQGYMATSNSIKDVIGRFLKDKSGNINTTGAMANALKIVRTESTRVMNDAAMMNTEKGRSEGLEIRRFWIATLDGRTRQLHGQLDGQFEDDNGMWNGDVAGPGRFSTVGQNVNCRCSTGESVNGSKPTLRRGRNPQTGENEVFNYKTFDQWAEDNNMNYDSNGKLVPKK